MAMVELRAPRGCLREAAKRWMNRGDLGLVIL